MQETKGHKDMSAPSPRRLQPNRALAELLLWTIPATFDFEHFEQFIAEKLFYLIGIRRCADHECVIVVEAAIGGDDMQMWIELLEFAKTLGAIEGPGLASS